MAFLLSACTPLDDPTCPPPGSRNRAELSGGLVASLLIEVEAAGEGAPDGASKVRATLSWEGAGKEPLVLYGPATCSHGIVKIRLAPGANEAVRVLGAAVEAIYHPSLVPGDLVGGWRAVVERPGVPGQSIMTGLLGAARTAPSAQAPPQ